MYYQHLLFYLGLIIAGCTLSSQKPRIETVCRPTQSTQSHEIFQTDTYTYEGDLTYHHASIVAGIRAFCSAMDNQDYQGYWPNLQYHRCYQFDHINGANRGYTLHLTIRSSLNEAFRIPTQRCLNAMCKLLTDCPGRGGKVDYGGHWQMEIAAQLTSPDCKPEKGWHAKKDEPIKHCWDPVPGHESQHVENPELIVQQGLDICLTSECLAGGELEWARRAA